MATTKEVEKAIQQALENLNVSWCREDLETVLADEDIPITDKNMLMLCSQIGGGFREMLVDDIFQRLHDLAGQMTDD